MHFKLKDGIEQHLPSFLCKGNPLQELGEIWHLLPSLRGKKIHPAVKELRAQVATLINRRMRRYFPLKRKEKRGESLTLKAQQGTQIPVNPAQATAGNCNSRAVTLTASGWGIQACLFPIFCKTRNICFQRFLQLLIKPWELSHCRICAAESGPGHCQGSFGAQMSLPTGNIPQGIFQRWL